MEADCLLQPTLRTPPCRIGCVLLVKASRKAYPFQLWENLMREAAKNLWPFLIYHMGERSVSPFFLSLPLEKDT